MTLNLNLDNINAKYIFSFALAIITYGFALSNFTLSIDNEIPIFSGFGLDNGRWGQNLIRYHLFNGHLQYFTLLLSLFVFSISAVRISKIFNFKEFNAFCFIALFVTFPQISYQVVFSMMADVAAIGVLLSILSVEFFIKSFDINISVVKKYTLLFVSVLFIIFTLSIYQALILMPITIYVMYFFLKTYNEDFSIKQDFRNLLYFGIVLLFSGFLYYISVKLFCPPLEQSTYLSSFANGSQDNMFINFLDILVTNIFGNAYFGEKLFLVILFIFLILTIKIVKEKKLLLIRILILFFLLISPFLISYFITNGYHPPRIYVTTNLVFAFFITFVLSNFNFTQYKLSKILILIIIASNIYMVTKLFYTCNNIYKHDKRIAEKIDFTIQNKYPNFNTTEKHIYFHGCFPYEYHQKLRLDKSEIFGGSVFNWDNGNNYRIINFIRVSNIEEYKMIENLDLYNSIKDSIPKMPIWPNPESVKMINNVMVVKLGQNKGMPLFVE
jgi:Glucosyl transferase GtrII